MPTFPTNNLTFITLNGTYFSIGENMSITVKPIMIPPKPPKETPIEGETIEKMREK
jgi:hypothetical protein